MVFSVQVAVLDVDVCGPSIPVVMGLEGEQVHNSGSGWSPVVIILVHTQYSSAYIPYCPDNLSHVCNLCIYNCFISM